MSSLGIPYYQNIKKLIFTNFGQKGGPLDHKKAKNSTQWDKLKKFVSILWISYHITSVHQNPSIILEMHEIPKFHAF